MAFLQMNTKTGKIIERIIIVDEQPRRVHVGCEESAIAANLRITAQPSERGTYHE